MEQFARVIKDAHGDWPTPRRPPKQKMLVRLSESATREQREDVINGLRTFFKNDQAQAIDTRSRVATMDRAIGLLHLFFARMGAMAMVRRRQAAGARSECMTNSFLRGLSPHLLSLFHLRLTFLFVFLCSCLLFY